MLDSDVAHAVRDGLLRPFKRLPSWLHYDAEGARLHERITQLPEYYLARAERGILERYADAFVAQACEGARDLRIAELASGSATRSQLVVRAALRRFGRTTFMPTDSVPGELATAVARLSREQSRVTLVPIVGPQERALEAIAQLGGRRLVLFLGSSIGTYPDDEALQLLRRLRSSLRAGDALLLGTDLRKEPSQLLAPYDDPSGVTAAFNKNVLARINRELDANFDPERFRHVAVWNAPRSRVEMHLESSEERTAWIEKLGVSISLQEGERIHTESSVKYDGAMVEAMLYASSFERVVGHRDPDGLFEVHLARAVGRDS